ncbi:tRNA synthetases class I family protein, partial [Chlamydia psittaci 06-1683]
SACV